MPPGFIEYLTGRDLILKGAYARRASYYRLQVVLAWLMATGHRGLLLFIDEVDNVVRQIHGKGHSGCFRTLAWYCNTPALPGLRTVFAATPEVLALVGSHGSYYQTDLASQRSVWPQEDAVFANWLDEARKQARLGWPTCPRLGAAQRVQLFGRISRIHHVAWNSTRQPNDELLSQLANESQFRVSRRWVRAAVQLLDLLNPPCASRNGSD